MAEWRLCAIAAMIAFTLRPVTGVPPLAAPVGISATGVALSVSYVNIGSLGCGTHSEWTETVRFHREGKKGLLQVDKEVMHVLNMPNAKVKRLYYAYSLLIDSTYAEFEEHVVDKLNQFHDFLDKTQKLMVTVDMIVKFLVKMAEDLLKGMYPEWDSKGKDFDEAGRMIKAFVLALKASRKAAEAMVPSPHLKAFFDENFGKPGWDVFVMVPLWSHHYIIVETDGESFYSLEKFCDAIHLRRSTNFASLLSHGIGNGTGNLQERKKHRLARPEQGREPKKHLREVKDIRKFLEVEIDRPYHLLRDNCHSFAFRLWYGKQQEQKSEEL